MEVVASRSPAGGGAWYLCPLGAPSAPQEAWPSLLCPNSSHPPTGSPRPTPARGPPGSISVLLCPTGSRALPAGCRACVGGWLVVPRQEGLASGLGSISQRSLGLASRPFWAAPSLSAPSPPCGFVDTPRWAQATGRGGNKDHHGNAAITAPGMLPCWAPTPHRPQLLGATSTLCSCCPGGPGVGAWDHTRWAPTRTAPPCPLPLSLLTSTLWVVPT